MRAVTWCGADGSPSRSVMGSFDCLTRWISLNSEGLGPIRVACNVESSGIAKPDVLAKRNRGNIGG
jgi:hypothetical protein